MKEIILPLILTALIFVFAGIRAYLGYKKDSSNNNTKTTIE